MVKVGERVGAIQKANETSVYLFGYGVYEGNHIPEEGWLHEANIPNPKIVLDDGRSVYGYQCWWGPEDSVKRQIGDREIIIVEDIKYE